jgi:hypothetical protein
MTKNLHKALKRAEQKRTNGLYVLTQARDSIIAFIERNPMRNSTAAEILEVNKKFERREVAKKLTLELEACSARLINAEHLARKLGIEGITPAQAQVVEVRRLVDAIVSEPE